MTPGSIRLGDGSRAACTACSRLYNVVTFHIKLVSTMLMAIYARVSTKDKGQDTQNQIRELREFAESSFSRRRFFRKWGVPPQLAGARALRS
ncbi:MAG: hypothetical protein JWN34_951 [Bryobacterales bacterium]|nr:hypothetical protein [Bryobacterales bacterium]